MPLLQGVFPLLEMESSRAVCGTRGSLRTMHGGGSAPLCCAFPHRVAFVEGSGPRAGRDWGQEEKGMTEDEMAGWHHRLDGREFE